MSITEDDDSDIIDTSYRVIFDLNELESVNIQSKYSFLISMLSTVYDLTNNISINNQPINKKYLIEIAKSNYVSYNKIVPNIFRILIYYLFNKIDSGRDVFKYTYNDFTELSKLILDSTYKNFVKSKYPELYRFVKTMVLLREDDIENRRKSTLFNFNRRKFKSSFKLKLTLKYGRHFDDDFLDEITEQLSRYTYKYFKSVIFLHPITLEPIIPIDIDRFIDEVSELYIEFMFDERVDEETIEH